MSINLTYLPSLSIISVNLYTKGLTPVLSNLGLSLNISIKSLDCPTSY